MNPYQFEVTCSVCGGPGVGTAQTAADGWIAGTVIRHNDPRVCQHYIQERERKMQERIEELESKS